ncbi:MAG: c-type cytochrome [Candidatus Binataceae bacterium]
MASRLVTIAAFVFCASCNSKPPDAVERGRIVYVTNCIVCHNPDPNLPGTQGPPIAGSSEALLEARVLHLSYPPGYVPQRDTHAMRAFPMLKSHIGDLAAFLRAAKQQQADRKD